MKWIRYSALICLFLLFSCTHKQRYVVKHPHTRDSRIYYPYVAGDLFRFLSDHVVDETAIPFYPKQVKKGDVVFVKTKYLDKFVRHMHPHIKEPYILITGNGDEEAPGKWASLLEDKKIAKWFALNAVVRHPRLEALPIGAGGDCIVDLSYLPQNKERLVYLNCGHTHPERVLVKSYFSNMPFCTVDEQKPFKDYLMEIKRSQYNLCPRGNGIDCHRVWETLLMGTIPILKSTELDHLYADLPVLIVKEWNEVTEKLLKERYADLMAKKFDVQKLYADYWVKKIEQARLPFAGKQPMDLEKRLCSASCIQSKQFTPLDERKWVLECLGRHPEIAVLVNEPYQKELSLEDVHAGTISEKLFGIRNEEFDDCITPLYRLALLLEGTKQAFGVYTHYCKEEEKVSYKDFIALHNQGLKLLYSHWHGLPPTFIHETMEKALLLSKKNIERDFLSWELLPQGTQSLIEAL